MKIERHASSLSLLVRRPLCDCAICRFRYNRAQQRLTLFLLVIAMLAAFALYRTLHPAPQPPAKPETVPVLFRGTLPELRPISITEVVWA